MEHNLYDTKTLLGVYNDRASMAPPSAYFRDLLFTSSIQFDTEYVEFSKIGRARKLAPLVVPSAKGVPIATNKERVSQVRPAYTKPKDAVTDSRVLRRAPGFGELSSNTPMGPMQRYNAIVADILRQHRDAIERREEWLAAQAVLNGKVVLEDDNYPEVTVDFERDSDNTVSLEVGSRWGDSGVSILEDIEDWRDHMRKVPFGGPATRLTVTPKVWKVMRNDDEVRELLNLNYRLNTGAELKMGLMGTEEVEFMGRLSENLEVYVYSGYYEAANGTRTSYMSDNDVLLTSPWVDGVRCYGAILDSSAQFRPLPVFPKMWNEQDPSATFIMTQSAPLMVPVNPNATLKATVIA